LREQQNTPLPGLYPTATPGDAKEN
jgi:hypothetical protein